MGHPHAERAHGVVQAVSAGDLDEFHSHLADDVLWHVGGGHPLSGDYRGKEAVLEYHTRVSVLTGGTLKLEPIDILAGDTHLGIFLRATATAGPHRLDTTMVEAIRLSPDGKWAEYWGLAEKQPEVDAFWKELVR